MNETQVELQRVLKQTRQEEGGLPLHVIAKEIADAFDYAEQDYLIKTILGYR